MHKHLRTSTQRAAKDYICDACEWIRDAGGDDLSHNPFGMTQEQLDLVEDARCDGWKIVAGAAYLKSISVCDGDLLVFRARPEIHKLCEEYNIYPDFDY